MIDILNVFNVKNKEEIWLEDTNKELLKNNPFHFERTKSKTKKETTKLYDNKERIRDDILGKLFRNDVYISRKDSLIPNINQLYYFFNEKLELKHRHNKESLIDIFNIMIGNFYLSNNNISLSDKERISSILSMLFTKKKIMFPYKIIEKENFFEKIKQLNIEEKNKKDIIDKSPILDNTDYKGVLKSIFEGEQQNE